MIISLVIRRVRGMENRSYSTSCVFTLEMLQFQRCSMISIESREKLPMRDSEKPQQNSIDHKCRIPTMNNTPQANIPSTQVPHLSTPDTKHATMQTVVNSANNYERGWTHRIQRGLEHIYGTATAYPLIIGMSAFPVPEARGALLGNGHIHQHHAYYV